MSHHISIIILVGLLAVSSNAFTPTTIRNRPYKAVSASSNPSFDHNDLPFYVEVNDRSYRSDANIAPRNEAKKSTDTPPLTKGRGAVHKRGVFSPIVQVSKIAVGEDRLNKIRAKVISLHSDIIANFVNTSDTVVGNLVLKQLFEFTDKDHSGTIDESELRAALETLGFDWLKEKQITGIFERADSDANGAIDIDEWIQEAPKTLRTNLIKLAKKNGGDMGLLV
jgi:hypothetical protein